MVKITALKILLILGLTSFAMNNAVAEDFGSRLSDAALERTSHNVIYDGRYMSIAYPGGDVPANIGVCTDVVIRSYRTLGIDLQQRVHEDMRSNFSSYPAIWGLKKPDTNIDHRRVPNLETYFERNGQSITLSSNPDNFKPGDLVTWRLNGTNLPHIGIVTAQKNADGFPLVVHNIGAGPKLENILFEHKMIGHYRYGGI